MLPTTHNTTYSRNPKISPTAKRTAIHVHVTKERGRQEVQPFSFLISTLRPGSLTPSKQIPGTHCHGPHSRFGRCGEQLLPVPGFEPRTVQPVA